MRGRGTVLPEMFATIPMYEQPDVFMVLDGRRLPHNDIDGMLTTRLNRTR